MAAPRIEQGIGFADLPPFRDGDDPRLCLGIDLGSKTVKVVVQDAAGTVRYCSYSRHLSDVQRTLAYVLGRAADACPDEPLRVGITGSAGMALAEALEVPHTQEVVACRRALGRLLPQADAAIEIGGEDSKILYLTGGEELRMNSTCAGGTGGFIDTLAGMLDCNAEELNCYAHGCKTIHPIASRCAVFAQMDVRPLLNEGVSREDIAGSVFDAVAAQCIAGLACGRPIRGKVALLGGPMHFLSSLRARFQERLGLDDADVLVPEAGHLFVAQGAAFQAACGSGPSLSLREAVRRVEALDWAADAALERLDPLFRDETDLREFRQRHSLCRAPRQDISGYEGRAFLGVDSGSEAIKYALIAEDGSILHTAYERSAGNLVEVARNLLVKLYKRIPRRHDGAPAITIAHAVVTGYGEEYLRQAFAFDSGEVETVAHVRATQELIPQADFILDIGGQDIKCVWLQDGKVRDVVLNEACSSGCGALVSGMAWSMNVHLDRFIEAALGAQAPVDLGTRCTVFMTSRVRHAQKAGATVGDIAAGLAYSVVRNAVHKVIRVADAARLGNCIAVQGGTFANDAVLRAFEKTYGCKVHRADIAPYMGAYGAALIARGRGADQEVSSLLSRGRIEGLAYSRASTVCGGCANSCRLAVTRFDDGGCKRIFTVGNRCQRGAGGSFDALGASSAPPDMFARRESLLFGRPCLPVGEAPRGPMGLVRALDMYETYPFWHGLLTHLGFAVVLSDGGLDGRSLETIPSESLCYPAKRAHGQLMDLLDRGLPFVWLPYMDGVGREGGACPVVAEYPFVLGMVPSAAGFQGTRLLSPAVPSLFDGDVLHPGLAPTVQGALREAAPDLALREVEEAVAAGKDALDEYRRVLVDENRCILQQVRSEGGRAAIVAGRPYHGDPAVHHGIPGLLGSCGYAVLTEEAALGAEDSIDGLWEFPARMVAAARMAAACDDVDFVELTSFGCGLDAAAADRARAILREAGKMPVCLKIDEMNDLASARIRIRSMAAARDGLLAKGVLR